MAEPRPAERGAAPPVGAGAVRGGDCRTPSSRRGRWARRCATALVAAAAALAAVPAALAHVDIEPAQIEPGQPTRLTFSAPNEGKTPIIEVEAAVPAGAVLALAEAVPGWSATVSGRTVTWRGGRIPVSQYGLFTAIVVAPDSEGTLTFRAILRYADGSRQVFSPVVFVRAAEPARAADQAGGTLARFALGLAAAALALAVGLGFRTLWLWLRAGDPPGGPGPGASA